MNLAVRVSAAIVTASLGIVVVAGAAPTASEADLLAAWKTV